MALNPYLDFFANRPRMTGAIVGATAFVAGLYTSPAVIQFALGVGGLMTAFIGTAASIYAGLAITAGISIFAGVLAAMAITKMFQAKEAVKLVAGTEKLQEKTKAPLQEVTGGAGAGGAGFGEGERRRTLSMGSDNDA